MKAAKFVSIKNQFLLLAVLLVALSSALWGWWAWKNERHLLYERLEGEGKQMVTSLASPIINALLYEEMGVIEEGGLLDNFIEEVMNNTGFPVVHAFVTDQNGKVLTHNRYSEYGKTYSDALTRAAIAETRYVSTLIPGNRPQLTILDMAMPLHIYGKSWGVLRVGVSTAPLEEELQALAGRIVGAALLFFLLGALLSYLIGLNMARPLLRLTALMSAVSTDNLAVELPPRRPDEIGALQESFREMLERLRRSEAERERVVAQLIQSEKLASIGKIVAGVAHEVNNPLATISTCIHNLRQDATAPNRNLEIIAQGAERIERIVRQLTDYSRAGSLELQPIASDRFFSESAEFARMALKKHDVRLSAGDRCQPPTLLCLDKGKIQQVILNLLINAADASAERGEVRLTAASENGSYILSVHDHGSGISDEMRERIFDIFYTTKPAGEGTGIGLAICKSIIEMHGGALYFESRPGDTTFTVSIPISAQRGTA
ncbi:MAG: HAMP domain-containing protein [Deltaproteobacteria bacterium]|nr:HAMP domain-containing protein [Deltaproteobacteria bacterium]